MLQHVRDIVLGVADKDHRRFGAKCLYPAREGLVGHVVFHDIDQRLVDSLLPAGKLIEGYNIPVADQVRSFPSCC